MDCFKKAFKRAQKALKKLVGETFFKKLGGIVTVYNPNSEREERYFWEITRLD